jgi:hypothetical protein
MYKKGTSSAIPAELSTLIYESCMWPAVVHINPLDQSRWPLTYLAAMTLYRDKKGHFHFGTIYFPVRMLGDFSTKLLELFHAHSLLADTFFVHEL